ncbi:MAG: hypothetical protein V3T23_09335 [Nitrososphaerales archaeon]
MNVNNVMKNVAYQQADNVGGTSVKGMIDAALQIADDRRRILEEMQSALLSDDIEALKRLASKLCGDEDD